jgi:hypothetical protein
MLNILLDFLSFDTLFASACIGLIFRGVAVGVLGKVLPTKLLLLPNRLGFTIALIYTAFLAAGSESFDSFGAQYAVGFFVFEWCGVVCFFKDEKGKRHIAPESLFQASSRKKT